MGAAYPKIEADMSRMVMTPRRLVAHRSAARWWTRGVSRRVAAEPPIGAGIGQVSPVAAVCVTEPAERTRVAWGAAWELGAGVNRCVSGRPSGR